TLKPWPSKPTAEATLPPNALLSAGVVLLSLNSSFVVRSFAGSFSIGRSCALTFLVHLYSGNGGGQSHWKQRTAGVLSGPPKVPLMPPPNTGGPPSVGTVTVGPNVMFCSGPIFGSGASSPAVTSPLLLDGPFTLDVSICS